MNEHPQLSHSLFAGVHVIPEMQARRWPPRKLFADQSPFGRFGMFSWAVQVNVSSCCEGQIGFMLKKKNLVPFQPPYYCYAEPT